MVSMGVIRDLKNWCYKKYSFVIRDFKNWCYKRLCNGGKK